MRQILDLFWLVLAGWWLALGHLIAAVLNAVTILALPFAWPHLRLARLAIWPVGRTLRPYAAPVVPPLQ